MLSAVLVAGFLPLSMELGETPQYRAYQAILEKASVFEVSIGTRAFKANNAGHLPDGGRFFIDRNKGRIVVLSEGSWTIWDGKRGLYIDNRKGTYSRFTKPPKFPDLEFFFISYNKRAVDPPNWLVLKTTEELESGEQLVGWKCSPGQMNHLFSHTWWFDPKSGLVCGGSDSWEPVGGKGELTEYSLTFNFHSPDKDLFNLPIPKGFKQSPPPPWYK